MWENVWVMDWLFKKENNVQEWIGDIHGNLKPSYIRKQLGLPEFTKYYYGFLSEHVHSSSSAISHFGNFWSRGSKYNFREMEESDFMKIEHLEASLVNKYSFSPDVETYALNILYNHYKDFIESETKVRIEEITKQMMENSEKALAEFDKTNNRKSSK
jgi:hypothetical protein